MRLDENVITNYWLLQHCNGMMVWHLSLLAWGRAKFIGDILTPVAAAAIVPRQYCRQQPFANCMIFFENPLG